MTRGDVYYAELDPTQGSEQGGTRPVVIVSRDALNASAPIVVIVPLTGKENKRKTYPTHLEVRAGEGGVDKDSVALCEQIRSISKSRLKVRVGHLPASKVSLLNATLKITLDL